MAQLMRRLKVNSQIFEMFKPVSFAFSTSASICDFEKALIFDALLIVITMYASKDKQPKTLIL